MIKKIIETDMVIDTLLILFGIVILFCILIFSFILFTTEIPNYQYGLGVVQYKNEYKIVSENDGIIVKALKDDNAIVVEKEPIFIFKNKDSQSAAKELEIRRGNLENEYKRLSELKEAGLLDGRVLISKQSEIDELKIKLSDLTNNTIRSPFSGKIYFLTMPNNFEGAYIEKGTSLGYIYNSDEKVIVITFNSSFVNRFEIGNQVKFFYKETFSYRSKNFFGKIDQLRYHRESSKIELICAINKDNDDIAKLLPGTIVQTSVFINSSSLFKNILGFAPSELKVKLIGFFREISKYVKI